MIMTSLPDSLFKESPCRACKTRFVNCHASCLKYKDWKQKLEVEKKSILSNKSVDKYFLGKYKRIPKAVSDKMYKSLKLS